MRIGVLTGGGDCPGLNAVIRAIVRRGGPAHKYVGFRHGWRGVLEGETVVLDAETTRGLLHRGGTILGTSRTNPFKTVDGPDRVIATMAALGVDALVAIGGDDTLGAAERLGREHSIPIVGVPKTIDNDISATDVTFGFHTAVQVATDAIDRLHTTAESHDRVMVVEVMGRNAGWIAATAGLAGGADVILIPEDPFDVDQVCAHLQRRHQRTNFSIVVVAEGAVPVAGTLAVTSGEVDEFGHERLGGISTFLQGEIEARTGWETRVANLGHILRGGTPSAYDRVLATRFGVEAIDAVLDCDFGTMVALRGTDIVRVPIAEAVGELKTIDRKLFEVAEVFFG